MTAIKIRLEIFDSGPRPGSLRAWAIDGRAADIRYRGNGSGAGIEWYVGTPADIPNHVYATFDDLLAAFKAGPELAQYITELGTFYADTFTISDYIKYDQDIYIDIRERTPIGSILAFGGSSAPTGFLICDGSSVSRTDFADLFTTIGVTYGSGNGTTTFTLPDLRQRFPLGKSGSGTGNTLGGVGGNIDHTHHVDPAAVNSGTPSTVQNNVTLLALGSAAASAHTHSVDIPDTVSGSANPPFQTVNYIIRT